MADMVNVDSDRILAAVNQLESTSSAIVNQMGKIVEAVAQLDKGWISSAKADFMSRYNVDKAAMEEMVGQYDEINKQLKDTASDFDKTEGEIMGGVNSLRPVG